jgi:hypothetical protein
MPKGSQLSVGFGDPHPLDRLGPIGLLSQFLLDFAQKPLHASLGSLHPFYAYPINPRSAPIGAHLGPSRRQRLPVADPPVERAETILGFLFGLLAQLLSQLEKGRRQNATLPLLRALAHPFRLFRSGIDLTTQSALPSSDSALSALRPLGSTIVTRFPATTGRSDSHAQPRPVMNFLTGLAPLAPPPSMGLPGSLVDPLALVLSALTPEGRWPASVHCFDQRAGFTISDKLATFVFGVTRLISVRLRYGSAHASRSSHVGVAAAAVRVASCLMNNYMTHLSVRSINQAWPGAPDGTDEDRKGR